MRIRSAYNEEYCILVHLFLASLCRKSCTFEDFPKLFSSSDCNYNELNKKLEHQFIIESLKHILDNFLKAIIFVSIEYDVISML